MRGGVGERVVGGEKVGCEAVDGLFGGYWLMKGWLSDLKKRGLD